MKKMKFITNVELYDLLEQEFESGKDYMDRKKTIEIDGLLYSVYQDKRTGNLYASRTIRTVHMGFNSNDVGAVEKLTGIVEREGACYVSWDVTRRTKHSILAHRLSEELPQYDFDDFVIGQNYRCLVTKKDG